RQPVEYQRIEYGTEELGFGGAEDVPSAVAANLGLAVGGNGAPCERWRELGWSVVDSHSVSTTPDVYRSYIQSSRGEFSVAKNLYVATRSGWFSCRSVCYLASGRPVVVQDSGFSERSRLARGCLLFQTLSRRLNR